MLFLGMEFSAVAVVTLISPIPAFCLELSPANSSLLIRDVQSLFAFAYSLFLKLFEKF